MPRLLKKINHKPAMTFLELIIVFGIIAVITGLGISGLITFRAATELQSEYTDISSSIKRMQNKANLGVNVQSGGSFKIPYIYAILFGSNNYSFYYCDLNADGITLTCVPDTNETGFTTGANSNISLTVTAGCSFIGAVKLSGDLVSINTTTNTVNTGLSPGCVIKLTHSLTGEYKQISINLNQNFINLN